MKKKIVFASQEKVKLLQPWLEKIRKALGVSAWFITDDSSFADFLLSAKELTKVGAALGLELQGNELLVEIAKKLKDQS